MKKMHLLNAILIMIILVAFSYSLPTFYRVGELERLTKRTTEAIRTAKENFNRDERISNLNVELMSRHQTMLGSNPIENLHHGCIYDPQSGNPEKPLMEAGFRFLENINKVQLKDIETTITGYQAKYPRAWFMVDFFSVFIARDHEGKILNWNKHKDGFSIWYAPDNAFDFVCPARGVIFS